MYSNNDFRYYKGGSYLAHYGVKGMKWHKHLKAATDWWKYGVTGSGYRDDAQKYKEKSDAAHRWSQKKFTDYQKSNKKTDIDTAAKYAHRSQTYDKQSAYNKEQYKKKRDVKSRLKNAISTKTRNTKLFIDSRITGSTAKKTADKYDREYHYNQKGASDYARAAGRMQKHGPILVGKQHAQNSQDELRRRGALYNEDAVKALNKRNKAQSEYEKSLKGNAEKRINSFFKKRKQKKVNKEYLKRKNSTKEIQTDPIEIKPINVKPIEITGTSMRKRRRKKVH